MSKTIELNSVRLQAKMVSMEAFAGGDIQELLTATFPSIVSEVKEFFGKFTPNTPGIVMNIKEQDFIKSITKHPYMEISPLAAFVPEGMNTTYLEYSKELLEAATHAGNILNGVMSSYTVFLAQLVSNKEAKLSASSFIAMHRKLEENRAILNNKLGKCFDNSSSRTEVTIETVIDRNSDWEHVFKNIDAIMKLMNSVDLRILNKKINECSELLDTIMIKIKRNDFDDMSPEAVNNLADGAFQVASELEFFSAIFYKSLALANSVERTVNYFNKVIDTNKEKK